MSQFRGYHTTRRGARRYLYKPAYGYATQRLQSTRARQAARRRATIWARPRFATNGGRQAELKFHDLDIDDAVIAINGSIAEDSCNSIAQGVTESTRIGRKCTVRQINWRFKIELAEVDGGTDPQNNETIRVILYLDKQANGAAATVTAILESDDFQSFNNLANKSRFRTLMDRTYDFNTPAGAGNGTTSDWASTSMNDSLYKKVNIPLEFSSTTGAITEMTSNNIGVLLIAKAGNITSFASKMRLRFSDN